MSRDVALVLGEKDVAAVCERKNEAGTKAADLAPVLRFEDGDFVPVNGGLLARMHLFGHSRAKLVRSFLARAQRLLVLPKRDRNRFAGLAVDQQDPAFTALLVGKRHDLLAKNGNPRRAGPNQRGSTQAQPRVWSREWLCSTGCGAFRLRTRARKRRPAELERPTSRCGIASAATPDSRRRRTATPCASRPRSRRRFERGRIRPNRNRQDRSFAPHMTGSAAPSQPGSRQQNAGVAPTAITAIDPRIAVSLRISRTCFSVDTCLCSLTEQA